MLEVPEAGASSPQANESPRVVLEAMRWMPRPSLRTLALVALALAVFALRKAKKSSR